MADIHDKSAVLDKRVTLSLFAELLLTFPFSDKQYTNEQLHISMGQIYTMVENRNVLCNMNMIECWSLTGQ